MYKFLWPCDEVLNMTTYDRFAEQSLSLPYGAGANMW